MTIQFRCSHCKRALSAADSAAGGSCACPGCGREVVVPRPSDTEQETPPIQFSFELETDNEMDMTPMVDVTFLLLIFFMVTAAFALQKSFQVPTPEPDETAQQARTIEEIEEDNDYIVVQIAADNTVWVDDRETHGEQDLLVKLRESRDGDGSAKGPSSLMVMADPQCTHETVVMVLDAGQEVGMENVSLATVDQSDL